MLHPTDDDFITRLELVGEAPRELIGERRHIGTDQHLTGVGRAQKVCHGGNGGVIESIDLDGGWVKYAGIAVVTVKKIDDAINGLPGHLRARRVIKIDASLAIICCSQ